MENPFEILGVARDASEADIKAAFRKKAKDCHPDTHPDDPTATQRFAEVSDAYDKLKDGKAATYEQPSTFHHHYAGGFHGAADPFSHGFGINVEELFKNIHAAQRRQRGRNDDIGDMITISFEEAYHGKKVTLKHNLMSGLRAVEVAIPPGVEDGQRLRVPGAGHDADKTLPRGDLFVTVHVVPHPDFQRAGIDLVCLRQIDVFTALLGGTTTVSTIKGTTIEVSIPKLVESGKQLRVAGHGMPAVGVSGKVGDLIVVLEVKMPKSLRQEQLDLIDKARALAL